VARLLEPLETSGLLQWERRVALLVARLGLRVRVEYQAILDRQQARAAAEAAALTAVRPAL